MKHIKNLMDIRYFYTQIAILVATIATAITFITLSINNFMLGSSEVVNVEGNITEISEQEVYDDFFKKDVTKYYYVIKYDYNNKSYIYRTDEGLDSKGEIGDKFTLYILADHPEAASMVSQEYIINVGKVVFGFGIAMVVLSVANIFILSFRIVGFVRQNTDNKTEEEKEKIAN